MKCSWVLGTLRQGPPLLASGCTEVSSWEQQNWLKQNLTFSLLEADTQASLSSNKSYSEESICPEGRFVTKELDFKHPEISRGDLIPPPETVFLPLPRCKPSNCTYSWNYYIQLYFLHEPQLTISSSTRK